MFQRAMAYFIILPVYLIVLLVLGLAAVIARCTPRLRPAAGYLVGGAVGTLPGFIVANGIVTLAGLLPLWLLEQFPAPEWLHQGCAMVTLAALGAGPLPASAAGVLGGFIAGGGWVYLRRQRRCTYPDL